MSEDEREFDVKDGESVEAKDDKSISADLIRGHINTIILRSLADGDKYGYEIIAEIDRKSHGQYSLKQPSLYSALKRLERDDYVTSYWGGSVGGGRRKYFSLTDSGRAVTEQNQAEWEYSRTIIDSLISDRDFDFSNPPPSLVDMRVLRDTTSRVPVSRAESGEELDFEPQFEDRAQLEKLTAALEEKKAELEARTSELEAARTECRERNEELETERAAYLGDRERYETELQSMRDAAEQLRTERKKDEQIALQSQAIQQAILGEREQERERLQAQIAEQNAALEAERLRHEQELAERNEALESERIRHGHELAEQEQRIRREQEELFRKREQEIIHRNYLSLVNTPPTESRDDRAFYPLTDTEQPQVTETRAPEEEDYRSVVRGLYDSSVRGDEEKPQEIERARSVDGIDFRDIESRAARDGIRITTAGAKKSSPAANQDSVVHKGKALFLSAIVVFILAIAEGGIVLGLQQRYSVSVALPYLMWGLALILLLSTGLAYANRYGERALRRCGPVLINAIISYILVVIVILIIALGVNIDFSDAGELASFVVIPVLYFFSIVVFGIVYYLQVKPKKD